MIHLDASALLALLLDEPGAADVESMLREGGVCITSVNYAEVLDQATRVQGKAMAAVVEAIEPLITKEILRVVALSPAMGRLAGELRAEHYDRKSCPVSLGDCCLLAAAAVTGSELATSDRCVADVATVMGLQVRRLPASRGGRAG